ncbi:uncharacterized protein EI90DRAFT_3046415 [Cantharellus anzutake]|uniref:uncharacterized protein n=1 Tax=Cantharellus anzutake TaxID=1750568 RepID=UPI0019063F75|nr:uncharacterized protein EI90DRAFT_3046415 [Cantharellus anzutake]KAF8336610.1 hypothetical protein EI90DRAFT_3046415 [Cantharellus anzutake]
MLCPLHPLIMMIFSSTPNCRTFECSWPLGMACIAKESSPVACLGHVRCGPQATQWFTILINGCRSSMSELTRPRNTFAWELMTTPCAEICTIGVSESNSRVCKNVDSSHDLYYLQDCENQLSPSGQLLPSYVLPPCRDVPSPSHNCTEDAFWNLVHLFIIDEILNCYSRTK